MALLGKTTTCLFGFVMVIVNMHLALSATHVGSQLPRSVKATLLRPSIPIASKHQQPLIKEPVDDAGNDVVSVARKNSASKFADFVLQTSWLASTLVNSTGPVTVFAFSDDAYAGSSSAVKAALANIDHPGSRDALLQYHVAKGVHYKTDIAIHGMDTTLYSLFPSPPLSLSTPQQPIHVDEYWVYESSILKSVVTASGAPVIKTDLQASNGIVHIIDRVMFPVPTGADMAQYLKQEPKYSKLYAGLQKANLTSALSTPDAQPLTLLAPSDAAFAKLSHAQKEALKNTTLLTKVLTYHVVGGSYYSAAIYYSFQLKSLEGSSIYFETGAGGISAQGQMLGSLDTTVTNGVVHELDGVMFPRALDDIMREN